MTSEYVVRCIKFDWNAWKRSSSLNSSWILPLQCLLNLILHTGDWLSTRTLKRNKRWLANADSNCTTGKGCASLGGNLWKEWKMELGEGGAEWISKKRLKNQITAGRWAHGVLTQDEDPTSPWHPSSLDSDAKIFRIPWNWKTLNTCTLNSKWWMAENSLRIWVFHFMGLSQIIMHNLSLQQQICWKTVLNVSKKSQWQRQKVYLNRIVTVQAFILK